MSLLSVIGGQWAIHPTKLIEIQNIYSDHLSGKRADIAAIESKLGKRLDNSRPAYTVDSGVAVVPINGVIAKKMNLFAEISGGTSSQLTAIALNHAVNNPDVHSIMLSIDSPGGTVDGTQMLADVVRSIRQGGKPIVTLAGGSMCSAAYWIGSAAAAVYIEDGTTAVGSIGVVTSHTDISGAESARGIKTTEISAGKYKRISSQYGPLSEEGRQTIQDQLDYTYSLFVDAVAVNRNVPASAVIANMADGKVFIGKQAIDAGLVDGVMTYEALIVKLNQDHNSGTHSDSNVLQKSMSLNDLDTQARAYATTHGGDYLSAVKAIQGKKDYGSFFQ